MATVPAMQFAAFQCCNHRGVIESAAEAACWQVHAVRMVAWCNSAQHVASEPLHAGLLFFRHGVNTTCFIDVWQQRLDSDSKVCGWGWGVTSRQKDTTACQGASAC